MHSTNKAFERYFRVESEEVRDVYAKTRPKDTPNNITGFGGRSVKSQLKNP